jgi:hypothetical protein
VAVAFAGDLRAQEQFLSRGPPTTVQTLFTRVATCLAKADEPILATLNEEKKKNNGDVRIKELEEFVKLHGMSVWL